MTPEEFRQFGHQTIDWIAEFLAHPERYPVLPPVKPGQLTDALPAHGPERGEPMADILADFERLIVPAIGSPRSGPWAGSASVSWPGLTGGKPRPPSPNSS